MSGGVQTSLVCEGVRVCVCQVVYRHLLCVRGCWSGGVQTSLVFEGVGCGCQVVYTCLFSECFGPVVSSAILSKYIVV